MFGTLSSAQTLSRMVSYTVANLILARAGPAGPYWVACAIAAVALALAIVVVGPMGKPEVDRDFDDSDAPSAEAVAPGPEGTASHSGRERLARSSSSISEA